MPLNIPVGRTSVSLLPDQAATLETLLTSAATNDIKFSIALLLNTTFGEADLIIKNKSNILPLLRESKPKGPVIVTSNEQPATPVAKKTSATSAFSNAQSGGSNPNGSSWGNSGGEDEYGLPVDRY